MRHCGECLEGEPALRMVAMHNRVALSVEKASMHFTSEFTFNENNLRLELLGNMIRPRDKWQIF
jgi:hypothetical protein